MNPQLAQHIQTHKVSSVNFMCIAIRRNSCLKFLHTFPESERNTQSMTCIRNSISAESRRNCDRPV